MDDSSDQTGQGGQQEGSWLRRRRGTARRAQRETSAPAGPGPVAEVPFSPASPVKTSQATAIWTDSHCHLQDEPDPAATLALARAARVGRVVCVGTDEASSRRAVMLAKELSGRAPAQSKGYAQVPGVRDAEVWATVGLHPHDAKAGLSSVIEFLDELSAGEGLRRSRVVAIGECGLDYHYDHSPREVQRKVFAEQIALAHRYDLALVIHTREAWDDTFAILDTEGVPRRLVFHCFSGGPDEAQSCLGRGAYLSFSGIVTFTSANELREAARICPMDRMLVETDSPFLTPVPHRGKPNEPAFVTLVGAAIAAIKGTDDASVAQATTANAAVVFDLHG